MIDLIQKRHEGDAWCVFTELADGTGWNLKGWADAAALGLWKSRGYELHGYECKISREDLKKELRDPGKADNVGKYCHYWWLVISDVKLMEGLVIPDAWGILTPKGSGKNAILRVVRKAPKNKNARPYDAPFVVSMIRNIMRRWVPKDEHEALKRDVDARIQVEAKAEVARMKSDATWELKRLQDKVNSFKAASGIDIVETSDWELPHLGDVVKQVIRMRDAAGSRYRTQEVEAAQLVRQEIQSLERSIEQHQKAIGRKRATVQNLESALAAVTTKQEDDDEVSDPEATLTH